MSTSTISRPSSTTVAASEPEPSSTKEREEQRREAQRALQRSIQSRW